VGTARGRRVRVRARLDLYFINRYRTDEVALTNLSSLVSVLGGAAVLALFPAGSALFGAYGVGLLLGFLSYLAVLALLVGRSKVFSVEWFLDGRRGKLADDEEIPEGVRATGAPMSPADRRLPS
jgi:hypothetical protein